MLYKLHCAVCCAVCCAVRSFSWYLLRSDTTADCLVYSWYFLVHHGCQAASPPMSYHVCTFVCLCGYTLSGSGLMPSALKDHEVPMTAPTFGTESAVSVIKSSQGCQALLSLKAGYILRMAHQYICAVVKSTRTEHCDGPDEHTVWAIRQ